MPVVAYELFIQFADADGDVSTRSWNVDASTVVTDLPLMLTALSGLIVPLIVGEIKEMGFTVKVTPPVSLVDPLADVQELLVTAARTVNGFLKKMTIPTIDETKVFVAGTKDADMTDADVLAYHTALLNGIDLTGAGGSGIVEFSDSRGEDLIAIEYAVEDFSK